MFGTAQRIEELEQSFKDFKRTHERHHRFMDQSALICKMQRQIDEISGKGWVALQKQIVELRDEMKRQQQNNQHKEGALRIVEQWRPSVQKNHYIIEVWKTNERTRMNSWVCLSEHATEEKARIAIKQHQQHKGQSDERVIEVFE